MSTTKKRGSIATLFAAKKVTAAAPKAVADLLYGGTVHVDLPFDRQRECARAE